MIVHIMMMNNTQVQVLKILNTDTLCKLLAQYLFKDSFHILPKKFWGGFGVDAGEN